MRILIAGAGTIIVIGFHFRIELLNISKNIKQSKAGIRTVCFWQSQNVLFDSADFFFARVEYKLNYLKSLWLIRLNPQQLFVSYQIAQYCGRACHLGHLLGATLLFCSNFLAVLLNYYFFSCPSLVLLV